MIRPFVLTFLFSILAASPLVRAGDWPSWRGPTGDGISTEKNLPVEWSPTQNVAWKLELPGPAGSTPVVWGDRIYLTSTAEDGKLVLIAVSRDGKELWRQMVAQGNKDVRGDEGNSASPSPVTDGKHVWTFFANGILGCYTADGKEVWKFDVQDRYGKLEIAFGLTASPVLHEGVLYQQLIHGDGDAATREACVVALDAATGKEIWKVDRPSDAHSENESSYASAILYNDGNEKFLLSHGADFVVAHDLKDGHELWRCGDLNKKSNYDPTLRFVASPGVAKGLIVVPSAKKGPVVALKPNGRGDITKQSEFHWWSSARTPDVPSPLIVGDLVYLCMENGDLAIMRAKTGEQLDYQRTHRQRHRASPVYADGKIYLTARDGQVTVVKAAEKVEILAENQLGEDISSSPAISNGVIYIRSFQHLWAIAQGK
ncbi:PQQ-binding-like beta-propeller repeat protein [Schlesneria sp. DSM 10557]|uniref:outer membrane protein assembly factor BamB family protein n=1 Tax=Schlesneria sp. DSM 10557 TaxID=3044399 RepID=UPI0035A02FCF